MKKGMYIILLIATISTAIVIAQSTSGRSNQASQKKYVYGALFYHHFPGIITVTAPQHVFFARGNDISPELLQRVEKSGGHIDAMDYMGNEGWELINSHIQLIQGGLGSVASANIWRNLL